MLCALLMLCAQGSAGNLMSPPSEPKQSLPYLKL